MIETIIFNSIALCKIILATALGFLIGYKRKSRDKVGGSRTFALMSLASVLLTIISVKFADIYHYDFVRLMAYNVAGIGFLCSGLILKTKNNVEGLTGASCMFATVPMSFMIGLEQYFLGITSAILMFSILSLKYKRRKKRNGQRRN